MTAREPTKLGEVLRAAREAKFIDLARVERDTKIRARYLSALERGEYRDLPGGVYVKGFLRNYGIYLGLDPEYLIDLYRLEQGGSAFERAGGALPMGPRRMRVSRALVITPGALAAVVLTVLVIAFGVYLVGEFVTFARTPDLRITEPATDVVGWTGSQYTIRGTTEPNATITADGLRENPTVKADTTGVFEISVKLVPGANVVTLVANDPLTGRDSSAVRRTITVASVLRSAAPGGLVLSAPVDAATLSTDPVTVSGSAPPETSLTVSAGLVAPPTSSFSVVTLAGGKVPIPGSAPLPPTPAVVIAGPDSGFSVPMTLPPGTWDLSVAIDGSAPLVSVTHRVTVAPRGLVGTVQVSGATSYLEIDQDGHPMPGVSGTTVKAGTSVALSAATTLRIRVGNAAAVQVTINGIALGAMGRDGAVVEWRITRL